VDHITQSIVNNFPTLQENEYMYKADLNYCAQSCNLLSSVSVKNCLQERPLAPLVAINFFLCSKQRSIINLPEAEDPVTVLLYQTTKQESEAINHNSHSKWKALTTITGASEKHLGKIKEMLKNIVPNDSKVIRYIEQGENYRANLKRKLRG
jgi:hypothetical protein